MADDIDYDQVHRTATDLMDAAGAESYMCMTGPAPQPVKITLLGGDLTCSRSYYLTREGERRGVVC